MEHILEQNIIVRQNSKNIFAECSIDYDKNSDTAITFYKTIQNKFHFAYVYDNETYSTAFYHYIRFNISFIFLANILDSRKYSLQYGDAGEIRLNESINLNHQLVGIGMYDNNFNEKYWKIKKLLEKYNYSVPIVDSLSGKILEKNLSIG